MLTTFSHTSKRLAALFTVVAKTTTGARRSLLVRGDRFDDIQIRQLENGSVNAAGVAGVATPQYLTCRGRPVLTTPPPIF